MMTTSLYTGLIGHVLRAAGKRADPAEVETRMRLKQPFRRLDNLRLTDFRAAVLAAAEEMGGQR